LEREVKPGMQAIVSLLPSPVSQRVEELWDELEARFGLNYIRITPFPHFTWQLADAYDDQEIIHLLHAFALKQQPFHVLIDGVDAFEAASPIVFLKVNQKPVLNCVHQRLWLELTPFAQQANELYAPGTWSPHVTLALQDLGWDKYPEVMAFLREKELSWRIAVDNLTMLCQKGDGQAFIESRFVFGQGLVERNACG